jgi:polyphosphate:AMP phosphotransferase
MSESKKEKKTAKDKVDQLNEQLLEAQFELRKSGKGPVLLLIGGDDHAGKAEIIHTFYAWLDNRFLNARAFTLPRGLEEQMPRFWRYCRTLPLDGEIGFYLGSWYHQPLREFCTGQISEQQFSDQMQDILRFEQLLVHEGASVLKVWLEYDKSKPVHDDASPSTTVAMREWNDLSPAQFEHVHGAAQRMIELTSTEGAPWTSLCSNDAEQRDLQIGQLMLDAIRAQLSEEKQSTRPHSWIPSTREPLDELDYTPALDKDEYKVQLDYYQNLLRQLVRHPDFSGRSLMLVFEGTDAAGKGGTIRRITQCLDPRFLRVHGTRAPTDEERRQPYLMRFWRRIPAPGTIVVFDRSYYGRVLVERVEGFCSAAQWQRAYGEINDFEHQLQQSGTLVIKFWLAITQEEQLDRFEAREESPLKRYKLTDEDWRNRKQWSAYREAVHDMLEFTDTDETPWHLISSEDKRHGRIQALKIVCESLQHALK